MVAAARLTATACSGRWVTSDTPFARSQVNRTDRSLFYRCGLVDCMSRRPTLSPALRARPLRLRHNPCIHLLDEHRKEKASAWRMHRLQRMRRMVAQLTDDSRETGEMWGRRVRRLQSANSKFKRQIHPGGNRKSQIQDSKDKSPRVADMKSNAGANTMRGFGNCRFRIQEANPQGSPTGRAR